MTDKKIIIALDFDSYDKAILMTKKLDPTLCNLKVGSQLFTSAGPKIIERILKMGFDIFLDLKFHDIPNTVSESVKVASSLGVWMLNVHTSGGSKMMKAAKLAALEATQAPLIIGVTILTSLEEEDINEVGIAGMNNQVKTLSSLAKESSLDGIVCSAREVKDVKSSLGKDFLTVTPGIRASGQAEGDQSRVTSAKQAIVNGSDFLVIGRPITQSPDPLKSLENFIREIS